jgi:hypothetical protein
MFTPTVQDFIDSFRKYSKNNIHYLHVFYDTEPQFSFDDYDVVVLTYSCRLCYLELMSPHVRKAIADFRGLKVAFPQDEYQETNKLHDGIRELGIKLVFTCVPEDKIAYVYPPHRVPGTRFVRVLTGYVPDRLRHLPRHKLPPMIERPQWIGYRGRPLGYFWGDLAYYKAEIGRRFKPVCERRGIPHEIAWTEEQRIYQEQWYPFLVSCRSTLCSPSGLNVFDFEGNLEREFRELIKERPDLSYEECRPRIAALESIVDMGQVSPKMFEAAALGTVLVTLEGNYSGVFEPDVDTISFKRDFSNLDEVVDRVSDASAMQELAERVYVKVIASDAWTYARFIAKVDAEIDRTLDGDLDPDAPLDYGRMFGIKAYDQGFLEAVSLASSAQYPMSRWLDLSHLRTGDPRHAQLSAIDGAPVAEEARTSPPSMSGHLRDLLLRRAG